jgi:hypothetical protein
MSLQRIRELAGLPAVEAPKELLIEAKAKAEYIDSAEFTDELVTVGSLIAKIKKIVESSRWEDWMKVTDENYTSGAMNLNKAVQKAVKNLDEAATKLEDHLNKVSEE